MAQDTPTRPEPSEQTEAAEHDSRFHYYSGGEIKSRTDARPNPLLYIFFGIIILGAVFWALYGGALGPRANSAYRPVDGSQANLNAIQQQLTAEHGSTATYTSVDLSELPIPAGQTLSQAIAGGQDVYHSYCIGCHGPNQDGNGVNAQELNPKPRNLHDAPFMQAMSYQRINTSIHKGVPGTAMPRWENTLTDTQIGDAIAYVFSLTSPPVGTTGAATPAAAAEKSGAQSGGSKEFANGTQNSPKPITPPVGGNPAAHTSTAPPSVSGQSTAKPHGMMNLAPPPPPANTKAKPFPAPAAVGTPKPFQSSPGNSAPKPFPGAPASATPKPFPGAPASATPKPFPGAGSANSGVVK